MTTRNDKSDSEQLDEQNERHEPSLKPPAKKPFIEPSVSVPVDVLEATTFFQAPTIETSTV